MTNQEQNQRKGERRQLVYLQDNQLYNKTPFLFETDCDWPLSKLEKLSWEPEEAGRLSTSFGTFRELLTERNYFCKLIRQYEDKVESPKGFDVVRGATGNY